jgi:hypothetical protein
MKSFAIFMGLNCFFKNEGAKVVFQEWSHNLGDAYINSICTVDGQT